MVSSLGWSSGSFGFIWRKSFDVRMHLPLHTNSTYLIVYQIMRTFDLCWFEGFGANLHMLVHIFYTIRESDGITRRTHKSNRVKKHGKN